MTPDEIVGTHAFQNIKNRVSRYEYYESLGANETILSLTKSEGKTFGTDIEKLTIEWFQLDKRTNTQHDATYDGRKIEIKSSRYWGCERCYKFQHIEVDHDFEFLITAVLREDGIEFRIMNKRDIFPYLIKQGKQGNFLESRDAESIGTLINTREDLCNYFGPLQLSIDVIDEEVKCVIHIPK